MKSQLFLLSLLVTVLAFTGCQNDEGDDTSPQQTQQPTVAQNLAKNWRMIDEGVIDASGNFNSHYNLLPACYVDNITKYMPDSTYAFDEGATKCNASSPQVFGTGTWLLTNNNTQIQLTSSTPGAVPGTVTIQELTTSKLVLLVPNGLGSTNRQTFVPN